MMDELSPARKVVQQRDHASTRPASLPESAPDQSAGPDPQTASILYLQRAAGNQAVSQLVQRLTSSRSAAPAEDTLLPTEDVSMDADKSEYYDEAREAMAEQRNNLDEFHDALAGVPPPSAPPVPDSEDDPEYPQAFLGTRSQ